MCRISMPFSWSTTTFRAYACASSNRKQTYAATRFVGLLGQMWRSARNYTVVITCENFQISRSVLPGPAFPVLPDSGPTVLTDSVLRRRNMDPTFEELGGSLPKDVYLVYVVLSL